MTYGARGGNGDTANLPINYANGGMTYGEFHVTVATNLYVYVGQASQGNRGGWNGGAGVAQQFVAWQHIQSGGGGGTDVRYITDPSPTSYLNTISIGSRIIVAGGGGGADDYDDYEGGTTKGGIGGGLQGGYGSGDLRGNDGKPGTQTSGYAKGQGGPGTYADAGCGGGGYWGGYGANNNGSGGGGSSYISGNPMCVKLPDYQARTSWTQAGGNDYRNYNGNGFCQILLLSRD